MPVEGKQAAEVLEFWFVRSRPRQWFAKDPAFDALLRERFLALTRQACDPDWENSGGGSTSFRPTQRRPLPCLTLGLHHPGPQHC